MLSLALDERIELEVPPSQNTLSYYALKAAPLFGVWFVGLLVFLIYSFKQNNGKPAMLILQALALAGFAMLIGVITRWLWRVDVSQRNTWLTNLGIWIQSPSGEIFVSYLSISNVKVKEDWMQKWLHVDEIEITYMKENNTKKISIVGVENPALIVEKIQSHHAQLGERTALV
ncbi:MAG: hypothetical protein V1776_03230 [Candidatus Diapherotrites archaeon]